mmetsp:Transcript_9590/g.13108  ORF Transcript_9590/g.13108 Transcript_9590/m.13108 type:complete len:520 (+) Transcript_9590:261-1820(+)
MIKVQVLRFGPMGASVNVVGDSEIRGLILQREIAMFREKRDGKDVVVDEILEAYIERVREDEKLDLSLRPQDMNRISSVKAIVMDALEGSPSNIIPIGDKSSPDDIASYFHGMSKRDFKNAVGSLYKDGMLQPGAFQTTLIPEEQRVAAKVTAKSLPVKDEKGVKVKPYREAKDRVQQHTVFVGNLPMAITVPLLEKTINKKLGKGAIVETRLAVDENGRARGYAYVEFVNATVVQEALVALKGVELIGRKMRLDYADDAARIERRAAEQSQSSPSDKKPWRKAASFSPAVSEVDSNHDDDTSSRRSFQQLDFSSTTSTSTSSGSMIKKKKLSNARKYDIENLMDDDEEEEDDLDDVPSSSRVNVEKKRFDSEEVNDNDRAPKRWSMEAQRTVQQSQQRLAGMANSNKNNNNRPSRGKSPTNRGGPPQQRDSVQFESTLYVGNLPFQVTEESLKSTIESFVGQAGCIARVRLVTDKETGRPRGFAYVDVIKKQVANKIYDDMQDFELMGRKLHLDDATR